VALLGQWTEAINLSDESVERSICIVLAYRSLFARAYAMNPTFFFPGRTSYLGGLASQMEVNELAIPEEYLPPHEPDATVADVFCPLSCSRQSARHLEAAILHTNPFDMLCEISHLMEDVVNEAAAVNGRNMGMLPFEVTFGYLVGVVLTCAFPCFDEVAVFIDDFTPTTGLSAPFEFNMTTIQAVGTYCRNLRQRSGGSVE
jgi:hypothetical protein